MLLLRTLPRVSRSALAARYQSTLSSSPSAKEFKVVLDGDTLYVNQALAEALGWSPAQTKGVSLTLSGWAPQYFAITRSGSDSDLLARATVESSRNPRVQEMLDYLKDR
ncbi:hypothetical protein OBBRIDRAFT_742357 [Obba rivulosa]|uniref:Uncharacterized protein n=1 Tax=Obba rivulosa TaxID=1052685 RepID=A0A8E2AGK0_9APHY|nr:hypothetical protein OBBRIDRAFT_742357 [Obba rivulosa]